MSRDVQNEGQQNGPENQAGALRSDPVQTQVLETENLRCTYPANVTVTAPESGGEWSVVGTSPDDVVTFTQLVEGSVEEGIHAENCTVVLDPSEKPIEIDKAQVTLDNAVLQIDEGTAKITPEGNGIIFSGEKGAVTGAGTLQTTGISAETDTFTVDGSTIELLSSSPASYDAVVHAQTMILDNGAVFRTEEGFMLQQSSTWGGNTLIYPLFSVVNANKLYLRNGSAMRVDTSCNLDKSISAAMADGITEEARITFLEHITEAMGEARDGVYVQSVLSVTEGSRVELSGFSGVLHCEGKISVNGAGSVIEADNRAFFDKVCPLYSEIESGEPDLQLQYSHIQDMYDELEELEAKQGTAEYDADAVASLRAEIDNLSNRYWDTISEAYYMTPGANREDGWLVKASNASITDGAKVSLNGFLPSWCSDEGSYQEGVPGVYVENAEFSIVEDIPEEYREEAFVNTVPPYSETKDWLFFSTHRSSPLAAFINSKVRITTNADRYSIVEESYDEGSDGIVMPKVDAALTPLLIEGGDVEIYGGGTRPAIGAQAESKGGGTAFAVRALEEALQVDKGDAPAAITTTNILKPGKTKFYAPSLKSYFHSYPYVADVDVIYKADEGGKVGFSAEDTKSEVSQTIDKEEGTPQAVTAVADEGYAFLVWTDEEGNTVTYDKSLTIKKQDGVYAAGTYTAKFLKTADPLDKEALQEAIDAANKAKEDAEKAKEDALKAANEAAKVEEDSQKAVADAEQAKDATQKAAADAEQAKDAAQKAAEAADTGDVEAVQKAAADAQKAAEDAQKAAEEAQKAAEAAGSKEESKEDSGEVEKQPQKILAKATANVKKKTATVKWTKVKGATKYVIYKTRCDQKAKTYAYREVGTVSGDANSKTFSKIGKKGKFISGVPYKVYVVAYDGDEAIGKSPIVHFVYGSQGKKVNPKSIAVNTKAAKLHPGDTKKVKAKVKWPAGKKALGHVKSKVRFMSTNDEVATVSSKGVITAKAAGTCKVYAYAENGLWKTINVTVE